MVFTSGECFEKLAKQMIIRTLLILCISIFLGLAHASEVYRSINQDGKVTYSDKPIENSEKIQVPSGQTYSLPTLPESQLSPDQNAEAATQANPAIKQYKLQITAPKPETIFTSEVENIDLQLNISPALHPNDRIQIKLNQQPLPTLYTQTTISLGRFDRGTYQIQALVVPQSGKGKTKGKSEVLTIHQVREMIRAH